MKTIKNQLILFTPIALIITYILGYFVWKAGGLGTTLSIFQMYVPALTVLGLYVFYIKKPIFKKGDLGFNFKGMKYWIIVPILITVLSFLTYGVSYLVNPEMFDTKINIISGLEDKGMYFGNITISMIAVIFLNGLIGSVFNIPMFIGEELGWRGYLTPRLLKLFSPVKTFIIGAIIWGLWHAVMIMQGLNYPSVHPVLGIVLMIVICFPLGIIIQYLYFKSRSIFVAALAHAALNKSAMSASFILTEDSYNTVLYGPTGLVGLVVFGITAIILFNRMDWANKNTFSNN